MAGRGAALARQEHATYLKTIANQTDSLEFAMTDHLRMSGVYWTAAAAALLQHTQLLDKDDILDFVQKCQHPHTKAYSGSVNHDPHILYTLSAVQICALFQSMDKLDADAIMRYLKSLQNPDGSFAGDEWGEVDTRFSYCALCCASLLGRLDEIDVDAAVAYIKKCENFDGGYGCEPGGESHSGQVFTCVGALAIAGCLNSGSNNETLAWWLAERQTPGGGLNGRPQKDADVCYSWWVLSSLAMLGKKDWIDAQALRDFILHCQDEENGGISDKPGDEPDIFHTYFGIAGLSLLGTDSVPPMDAAHALPESTMEYVREWQKSNNCKVRGKMYS